MIYFRVKF